MIVSKCGAFPNKLPEKNCVTLKPDIALWSGTFTSAESAALQDFSKSQPAVDLLPLSQSTTFNKSLEVLRKAQDFHVCCHCCKLEALQLLVRWRFEIRRSHRHRIRYINNKKMIRGVSQLIVVLFLTLQPLVYWQNWTIYVKEYNRSSNHWFSAELEIACCCSLAGLHTNKKKNPPHNSHKMEASMLAREQRIFYNSPQPSRNDLFLILHSDAGFPTVITDKLEVISQVKKQKEKKERRTKHNTGVFSCIQNCILLEEACANCTAAPFEITEDYFSHLHFFSLHLLFHSRL